MSVGKANPPNIMPTFLDRGVDGNNLFPVLEQGEERREYPNIFSIQDNSLLALSSPAIINFRVLGAIGRGGVLRHDDVGVEEHIVQEGDTISNLAEQFNISTNTILWANDLNSGAVLQPGQKLIIPPITGMLHMVRDGDTVSQIAELYKIKVDEIVDFNDLSGKANIFIGDMLVIPNGRMPAVRRVSQAIPLASAHFMVPLSGAQITQGLHWYNAVDFATGRCGSPVYAAAGGVVQRVGWDRWAGRYLRIIHPNRVVTLYGHFSKIIVSVGQRVSQGEIIGYVGYSGHTIPAGPAGCHLHFEVRGARNPFIP